MPTLMKQTMVQVQLSRKWVTEHTVPNLVLNPALPDHQPPGSPEFGLKSNKVYKHSNSPPIPSVLVVQVHVALNTMIVIQMQLSMDLNH